MGGGVAGAGEGQMLVKEGKKWKRIVERNERDW